MNPPEATPRPSLQSTTDGKKAKGRLRGVFFKGMSMGAVETVPGVSSGTLALITGIYEELIMTLGNLRPALLKVWKNEGFAAFWKAGNLGFLSVLLLGMAVSIWPAATAITWLFLHAPILLWAFFFGLIVAGVMVVLSSVDLQQRAPWGWFLLGVVAALWIGRQSASVVDDPSMLAFFLSASVAICAMLLPGISGSFVLMLLGMHVPVMMAISELNVPVLIVFASGCLLGILSFVQLLRWLLAHFHDAVMAMGAGFMAGSMVKLWPWRVMVAEGVAGSAERNLMPWQFAAETGQSPQTLIALLVMLSGVALVLLFFWWGKKRLATHNADG